MIPLIRLKKDVDFNSDLIHIVDALKGIALARFHSLHRQSKSIDRFEEVAGKLLQGIDPREVKHPFVTASTGQPAALVIVTSDAGFLGGLNTQVIQAGLAAAGSNPLITVIGERGGNHLHDTHHNFTQFPGILDHQRDKFAADIRNHVLRQILEGKAGRLVVAYPKSLSLAVQKVTVETLLPCTEWLPKGETAAGAGMIWESSPAEILGYVVHHWMARRLTDIFSASRLAELGARVMHLEGSFHELVRRAKKLRLDYFRARHEIIDRSMREVFSAQLLFGSVAEAEEDLKLAQARSKLHVR